MQSSNARRRKSWRIERLRCTHTFVSKAGTICGPAGARPPGHGEGGHVSVYVVVCTSPALFQGFTSGLRFIRGEMDMYVVHLPKRL